MFQVFRHTYIKDTSCRPCNIGRRVCLILQQNMFLSQHNLPLFFALIQNWSENHTQNACIIRAQIFSCGKDHSSHVIQYDKYIHAYINTHIIIVVRWMLWNKSKYSCYNNTIRVNIILPKLNKFCVYIITYVRLWKHQGGYLTSWLDQSAQIRVRSTYLLYLATGLQLNDIANAWSCYLYCSYIEILW